MFPAEALILKFENFWRINAPKGYSMLLTPPMNRPGLNFRHFHGIINIDEYNGMINHPVLWTGGDFDGFIEKGTPLAQGIIFKRDSVADEAVVRPMNENDEKALEKHKAKLNTEHRTYRNDQWCPISRVSNSKES